MATAWHWIRALPALTLPVNKCLRPAFHKASHRSLVATNLCEGDASRGHGQDGCEDEDEPRRRHAGAAVVPHCTLLTGPRTAWSGALRQQVGRGDDLPYRRGGMWRHTAAGRFHCRSNAITIASQRSRQPCGRCVCGELPSPVNRQETHDVAEQILFEEILEK